MASEFPLTKIEQDFISFDSLDQSTSILTNPESPFSIFDFHRNEFNSEEHQTSLDKSSTSSPNLEDEAKVIWDLAVRHKKDWKRVAANYEKIFNKKADINVLKAKYAQQDNQSNYKKKYTKEDDVKLLKAIDRCGFDWMEISKSLPDRTPLSLRNRYYNILKYNKLDSIKALSDQEKKEEEVSMNLLVRDIELIEQPACLDFIESLMNVDCFFN